MSINAKDMAAGAMFIGIGLFFALTAWVTLPIGKTLSMGPGYFPVVLGLVLAVMGVGICLSSLGKAREAFGHVAWPSLMLVMGSILFFGIAVRGLGFAPTLIISAFMAAMAAGGLGWRKSAIVAVALGAISVGAFVYGLGLPYPLLGSWIVR
ncbi:MAG TPA: tripartite tricarboxylate transporter TctB family protein [Devosia sp.]|nr:tripartite tricarboxylate transporter TctB family protein [Devosia sp.]